MNNVLVCDRCESSCGPCELSWKSSNGIKRLPTVCPWDREWDPEWKFKSSIPDMPNPPPPPKQGAQFNVGEMMQKCKGCQAFYEATAECTLPGRCKEPGEKPWAGHDKPEEKPWCLEWQDRIIAGIEAMEAKPETTALVTADECLRVIELWQQTTPTFSPVKDAIEEEMEKAAKLAAKALQILLSFVLVTAKDADDADKTRE